MRAVLCINFELSRSLRTEIEIYNSVLEIRLARRVFLESAFFLWALPFIIS